VEVQKRKWMMLNKVVYFSSPHVEAVVGSLLHYRSTVCSKSTAIMLRANPSSKGTEMKLQEQQPRKYERVTDTLSVEIAHYKFDDIYHYFDYYEDKGECSNDTKDSHWLLTDIGGERIKVQIGEDRATEDYEWDNEDNYVLNLPKRWMDDYFWNFGWRYHWRS
jgi:hypothetical protein